MASLHLTLLCLAACTLAGPDHKGVAGINNIDQMDQDNKEVDHQERPNHIKGNITNFVNALEKSLEDFGYSGLLWGNIVIELDPLKQTLRRKASSLCKEHNIKIIIISMANISLLTTILCT